LSLLRPVPPRIALAVLALLPLAPVAARALAYLADPNVRLWNGLHVWSHTHCDGLLLGVLIAYLQVFHRAWLVRTAFRLHAPMLIAAAACFAGVFWYGGVFRAGVFAVVGQLSVLSLGFALIVVMALTVDNVVIRVLSHPAWYPIARVSYGMYLVHPFVALWLLMLRRATAYEILPSTAGLAALGTVTAACSFGLASALFLAVELPMLRWGARVAATTAAAANARRASS
jgi:peptidoglycan/LPS O-acetylase OafA/YrhL